jgi:serine/threonine protein kinase
VRGDVYSFGVMLLELLTGKRPTDVIFSEGLTLHDWVRRHYPQDVGGAVAHAPWRRDVVDGTVQVADMAVVELIELGLACTQYSPALRPSMADVCHEITLIKEDLAKHGGADAAADDGGRSFSTTKIRYSPTPAN